MRWMWMALALVGCAGGEPEATTPGEIAVEEPIRVVPSDGLPAEAMPQDANNNLDVTWHDGRLFLAFRTAPSHFASPDTRMVVVSSEDQVTWRYEGAFALGTDVREPQLVSVGGALRLYFAVLGDDSLDFEPGEMRRADYRGPGDWTEPVVDYVEGFIPWRIDVIDDEVWMVGYVGGDAIYDPGAEQVSIHWLREEAGAWVPAFGDDPVVLVGGGSETAWTFLDDGSVVAVVRNEAGDETGFGSKICTAPASDPATWTCAADRRKYDSPLIFREGGEVWLLGRRNVTDDGFFDLGRTDLDFDDQFFTYSADYWTHPKRCSLWRVDPAARAVEWVLDLPSRGDTCFPEAFRSGEGRWTVYNYSSPVDGPDLGWLEGQLGETWIYRTDLVFP